MNCQLNLMTPRPAPIPNQQSNVARDTHRAAPAYYRPVITDITSPDPGSGKNYRVIRGRALPAWARDDPILIPGSEGGPGAGQRPAIEPTVFKERT